MNNPDLVRARRINQAYEEYNGPEVKLNAPIMRDMAADKVIERRSWFPAIETAAWFESPTYMTRHENMRMTAGLDLRNRNESRAKLQPGQIAATTQFATTTEFDDTTSTTHKLLYIIGIVLVIGVIAMLF